MGIVIVGLGPGGAELLTREAWAVLTASTASTGSETGSVSGSGGAAPIYVRTSDHPAVAELPVSVRSFDHLYRQHDDFSDVYAGIVDEILRLGRDPNLNNDVIYAVPGHPFVAESTVLGIMQRAEAEGVPVRVVAGLSFVEPIMQALRLDALDGLQLLDAIDVAITHYPPLNPDLPVLLGQVFSREMASELKLTLMALYAEDHSVQLVHAAGTPEERVEALPLYAIDRSEHIRNLTTLFIPPRPSQSSINALAQTVAMLRAPGGCPWDMEQTPQSMRADLTEECAEVLAALDSGDVQNLEEELGDLLFHILFQAQMASEAGDFNLADVTAGINAKLIRRHPHIWGDVQVAGSVQVAENWEAIKVAEKSSTPQSALDNIPHTLPALAYSRKLQRRARKVGFDWPSIDGVWQKLAEEIAELKAAKISAEKHHELGDILLVAVNLALWMDVDAEMALRDANLRFESRFRTMEKLMKRGGVPLAGATLSQLNHFWDAAKALES